MSNAAAGWKPRGVDFTTPSTARMYDYYLGGKDNYAVDRETADQAIAAYPELVQTARNNRSFLERAVRTLAEAGIDQFIDVGTGIPTSPSVHEVAREVHPGARVVYVDHDPVVLAHNRALLVTDNKVTTIDADMRDPDGILTNPELQTLIDFEQPVGVLFVSLLHFAPGDEPRRIVRRFREAIVAGSYLAASIVTSEGHAPEEVARLEALYDSASSPVTFWSRQGVEELFDGFDLAEPGLVDVARWRNNETSTSVRLLAAVGRKR